VSSPTQQGRRREKQSGGGLSPKTLVIAGAASAITTIIVPYFWRPGTLFAAAATPVIVALVTEALKRPVDTVTAVTARGTANIVGKRGTTADAPPDEDETFDPSALLMVIEALAKLTGGVAVDPQSGTIM